MGHLLRFVVRFLPGEYRVAARGFNANARRYIATAMLQNVGYGIIGTTFAIHLKDSGFSEAVVGDVEGALALAGAIVCLVLPPLVSSLGYRRLMIGAALALGLARLGQAWAPSAVLVVSLGLLFGLGDGTMQTLSTAFLSENSQQAARSHLYTADFVSRIGSIVAGSLIGGVMTAALRPVIGEAEAVRATIVLASVVMMYSAVYAARIEDRADGRGRLFAGWLESLKGFTSMGRVARLLVPEMLISFGAGLVMPFVALYLRHHMGASVLQVGLIQALSSVAMAVAALSTPRIARKLGLASTIVLTELASLPFLVMIPLSSSLSLTAALFWVRGMLMNMSWPVYNQLSMEGLPARDKPLVAGWVRFGWSVAWLGGSAIGGRLMQQSYTTPYFYTAGFYAAGAIATFLLLRHITSEESGAGDVTSAA